MIKLSIKNLAAFALEDRCPKCLWVKHQLGYKTPFSIFPGVFSTIDSHCKRICDFYLAKNGVLPPWLEGRFPGFRPIKTPHYTKLTLKIGELETRGSPDYILKKGDELVVLDNKTSHFKDADDPLAKLYDIQLNGYGAALEENGHGKVNSLHLVYYDPIKLEETSILPITGRGPALEFEVKIRDVAVDRKSLEDVAAEAVAVLSLEKAPAGKEKCKDCSLLAELEGL